MRSKSNQISLLQAQQMAQAEGFVINRRGSIDYWLKLAEESKRDKESKGADIHGYWSTSDIVGGCSFCHQRIGDMFRLMFDNQELRACSSCVSSLRDLLTEAAREK